MTDVVEQFRYKCCLTACMLLSISHFGPWLHSIFRYLHSKAFVYTQRHLFMLPRVLFWPLIIFKSPLEAEFNVH